MTLPSSLGEGTAKEIGRRFGSDIYDLLRSAGGKAVHLTREFLEIGFSEYIVNNLERCSKVKTIVNRYERVSLLNIYEECDLQLDGKIYTEEELVVGDDIGNALISGTAGSGKSFFMKRSFLRIVEVNTGSVPIFFELRNLNDEEKPNLLESLFHFLQPHISNDPSVLRRMMERGKFVLLLDGYDELYDKIKSRISKQIERIIYNYPRCRIIISGRSSDSFNSWQYFNSYDIEPLTKSSCLSLINKAIFPKEEKDKFYKNVASGLFNTHREYLSNPLMTYVMMMTADRFGEFPKEMSAFYEKAFETLYEGHDIMKTNSFKREVRCNLKLKDLSQFLQYFCAISYVESVFQYDYQTVIKYISTALDIAKIEADPDDLLDDITNGYCLLIKDGLYYSYIHRSFQEYFAAMGTAFSEKIEFYAYNDRVVTANREFEGYISLIIEIAREKFISQYLLIALKQYISDMRRIVNKRPRMFLEKHISEFGIDEEGSVRFISFESVDGRKNYSLVVDALSLCEKRFVERIFNTKEIVDAQRAVKLNARREPNDSMPDVEWTIYISKIPVKEAGGLFIYKYFKRRYRDVCKYVAEIELEFIVDKKKLRAIGTERSRRLLP